MSLPVFSGEEKYSDLWLNIWKNGLPPGQVMHLIAMVKRKLSVKMNFLI